MGDGPEAGPAKRRKDSISSEIRLLKHLSNYKRIRAKRMEIGANSIGVQKIRFADNVWGGM